MGSVQSCTALRAEGSKGRGEKRGSRSDTPSNNRLVPLLTHGGSGRPVLYLWFDSRGQTGVGLARGGGELTVGGDVVQAKSRPGLNSSHSGVRQVLRAGDVVQAQYYEDGYYYEAEVHAHTCGKLHT